VAEIKLDGHRASCDPLGAVRSRNGRLLDVEAMPVVGLWLDGEVYDGLFWAFDAPQMQASRRARWRVLEAAGVRLIPLAPLRGMAADRSRTVDLGALDGDAEGVVYKRDCALYPGRGVTADWIKYRRRAGFGAAGRTDATT
jgi:hypothetical protein